MSQNKKTLGVVIAILAVVAIGTFFYTTFDDGEPKFEADPAASVEDKSDTWTENEIADKENGTSTAPSENSEPHIQEEGTPDDEYPKVSDESESDVDITFTDPNAKPPTSENSMNGNNETTNGTSGTVTPQSTKPENPPENDNESNYTDPEAPPETETHSQGDKNAAGQVYDEAFGWITPSSTIGENVDNDGDVDKQIGSMN